MPQGARDTSSSTSTSDTALGTCADKPPHSAPAPAPHPRPLRFSKQVSFDSRLLSSSSTLPDHAGVMHNYNNSASGSSASTSRSAANTILSSHSGPICIPLTSTPEPLTSGSNQYDERCFTITTSDNGAELCTHSRRKEQQRDPKYYELFKTKSTSKVLEKQFSRSRSRRICMQQQPPLQPQDDTPPAPHDLTQVAADIEINSSNIADTTARVNVITQRRRSTINSGDGNSNYGSGASSSSEQKQNSIVLPAAGRYFDALRGPELEILKDCEEELLLPMDKLWPFLLRFPIGCFGICLGLGSQAMLWKTLATASSIRSIFGRFDFPLPINMTLWFVALAALLSISVTYALKSLLYFEAVRREFHHPVRVNFFFAPWISSMFLALGAPPAIAGVSSESGIDIREVNGGGVFDTWKSGGEGQLHLHPGVWWALAIPLLMLELKIYGQWLSGGHRRLSKVANPSTHLSLVGNFVSSLLAARVGWRQPAIFFFAVGTAHYLVLFVTLYQRLPTAEALPKELHPVFFLFVAAPSTASVAWKFIAGGFDDGSKIALFVALFLYASLVVRIKFFCGFRFSIAWWAYTFPMTASAIASIHYSMEVVHPFTQALAMLLSGISTLTVIILFVSTIIHFICGSLFPNDIAIAITHSKRRKKKHKQHKHDSKKLDVFMPSLA